MVFPVARMEPPGLAFGEPEDRLRDIRDRPPRISLRSMRATEDAIYPRTSTPRSPSAGTERPLSRSPGFTGPTPSGVPV